MDKRNTKIPAYWDKTPAMRAEFLRIKAVFERDAALKAQKEVERKLKRATAVKKAVAKKAVPKVAAAPVARPRPQLPKAVPLTRGAIEYLMELMGEPAPARPAPRATPSGTVPTMTGRVYHTDMPPKRVGGRTIPYVFAASVGQGFFGNDEVGLWRPENRDVVGEIIGALIPGQQYLVMAQSARQPIIVDAALGPVLGDWEMSRKWYSRTRLTLSNADSRAYNFPQPRLVRAGGRDTWVSDGKMKDFEGQTVVGTAETLAAWLIGYDFLLSTYEASEWISGVNEFTFEPIIGGQPELVRAREGETNCVVKALRKALENGKNGSSLNDIRKKYLKELERRCASAERAGAFLLEDCKLINDSDKQLYLTIRLPTGELLFESTNKSDGKPRSPGGKRCVDIIIHNEHAFHRLPLTEEEQKQEAWLALPKMPDVVKSLIVYDRDGLSKHEADMLLWRIAKEQKGEVLFMIGDGTGVLKTGSGKCYKPRDVVQELTNAAIYAGAGDEKKTAAEHAIADECVTRLQYEFLRFRTVNKITACAGRVSGEQWKSASIEAKIWSAPGPSPLMVQYDMSGAYMCFAADGNEHVRLYRAEFGIVTSDAGVVHSINDWITDVKHPGWTEVVEWEFRKGLHPYIVGHYTEHFTTCGRVPNHTLAFMLRSGILTRCFARETKHIQETARTITFPDFWTATGVITQSDRKALARSMIGKCAPKTCDTKELICTNPNEAEYHLAHFTRTGVYVKHETIPGIGAKFTVKLTAEEKRRATYCHVRANALGYTAIALMAKLLEMEKQRIEVRKVLTDAIWCVLRKGEERPDCDPALGTQWGAWRPKGDPTYIHRGPAEYFGVSTPLVGKVEYSPSTAPPLILHPITEHRFVYVHGQGGNGKTTLARKLYPNATILCPENRMVARYSEEGCTSYTFHKFMHLGKTSMDKMAAKAADDDDDERDLKVDAQKERHRLKNREENGHLELLKSWTPACLGKRWFRQKPSVIIIDEICKLRVVEMEKFLPFFERVGIKVIMCGDGGQLQAIGEKVAGGVHAMLMKRADVFKFHMTEDYRAKTAELKNIKLQMHMQDMKTQLSVMRNSFQTISYSDFLALWKPSDFVIAAKHDCGKIIDSDLIRIKNASYLDSPVRLIRSPSLAEKRNTECYIPGMEEKTRVYKGSIVYAPSMPDPALLGENKGWKLALRVTVHSVQGETIAQKNTIYIIDDQLEFTANLPYTAVSRAESHAQIILVTSPRSNARAPTSAVDDNPLATRNLIARKLKAHAVRDHKENQVPLRPLTVDDVLLLGRKSHDRCALCGEPVKWSGYHAHDPYQFSLNRIDNSIGHELANVELTHMGCNREAGGQVHRAPRADNVLVEDIDVEEIFGSSEITLADLYDD